MNRSGKSSAGSNGSGLIQVQLYALVKWVTGAFAGQFCHNVKIEWIREFEKDGPWDPLGYAVEWRVPPMPRLGWGVYDAIVLDVSDDLGILKRKEKEYAEAAAQADANEVPQGLVHGPPQNPDPAQPQAAPQAQPEGAQHGGAQQVQPPAGGGEGLLQQLVGALVQAAANGPAVPVPAAVDPSAGEQVKIGKSLTITKSCLIQAKAARTPSAMTMFLTRGAFSKRRLQMSSYAGQRRRGRDAKPALKKYQAMRDIQDYVLQRFPQFSQASFGGAVNACTGKRAAAVEEMEYIDIVSDDEN